MILIYLDAQIVPDLAAEGPFTRVPVSFGLLSASTEHSFTSWHRKMCQFHRVLSQPQPGISHFSEAHGEVGVYKHLGVRVFIVSRSVAAPGPLSSRSVCVHTRARAHMHARSCNHFCGYLCLEIIKPCAQTVT